MKVNIGPYSEDDNRTIEISVDSFDTWDLDQTLGIRFF